MILFIMNILYLTDPVKADVLRSPGVKAGDWAKYDFVAGYNTSDPNPNPPIPALPPDYYQVEYFKLTVKAVYDTVIMCQGTLHYTYDLEVNFTFGIDLNNPATSIPLSNGFFLIAANLTTGDKLNSKPDSPVINETLTLPYAGKSRDVNYFVSTWQVPYMPVNYSAVSEIQVHCDRPTGLAVEIIQNVKGEDAINGYVTYTFVHLTIKETNLWSRLSPGRRVAGVKSGDWAKYGVTFNVSTDDPDFPTEISRQFEELEYEKLEVQSVVTTNVTFEMVMHYRNGTEIPTNRWIDVATGEIGIGVAGSGPIIAANITAGDKLYLNDLSPTLNATGIGMYAGSLRQINCLEVSENWTYVPLEQFVTLKICWDQMSGVFVDINETLILKDLKRGYTTTVNVEYSITETNIWKPTPPIHAEVGILPRILNVKSEGNWIIAFIELPKDCKATDVDQASITINNTIHVTGKAIVLGKRWLAIRFNRSEVISCVLDGMHSRKLAIVTLTITGKLRDGSLFEGSDHILIVRPPKRGQNGI